MKVLLIAICLLFVINVCQMDERNNEATTIKVSKKRNKESTSEKVPLKKEKKLKNVDVSITWKAYPVSKDIKPAELRKLMELVATVNREEYCPFDTIEECRKTDYKTIIAKIVESLEPKGIEMLNEVIVEPSGSEEKTSRTSRTFRSSEKKVKEITRSFAKSYINENGRLVRVVIYKIHLRK